MCTQGRLRAWGVDPRVQTFFSKNSIKKGFKFFKITKDRAPKILSCPYIHIKKLKYFFAQRANNILSRPCVYGSYVCILILLNFLWA